MKQVHDIFFSAGLTVERVARVDNDNYYGLVIFWTDGTYCIVSDNNDPEDHMEALDHDAVTLGICTQEEYDAYWKEYHDKQKAWQRRRDEEQYQRLKEKLGY